jgi:hypothetical protein
MFESLFGGGKKENKVSEGAGYVAVPGETGETLSDKEVSELGFSEQIIALERKLRALREKSDFNETDARMAQFLSDKIENLKSQIAPKSY